jgi:uncharacterized secreted repeat protein (TIGR03808 family)
MKQMNRRSFMGTLLATAASVPAYAAQSSAQFAGLRGSLDVSDFGVRPDVFDDQSKLLQSILNRASKENKPVFLPSGTYVISRLELPARTRLLGTRGASRIVYGGGGTMMSATGPELVHIEGIAFDGANQSFDDTFGGLLHIRACPNVVIEKCDFTGSSGTAITLDTCGGRLDRNKISGAAGLAAVYSVNATGLAITNNVVSDCSNGGLLVHRWEIGEDNTIVSGNRISRISARGGGTGQRGNGINLFRTNGVIVSNNHISDCAFSAVRANSASNAQILGNTCLRSGETALYAEFQFEGSIISNNIVDGGTIGISITNYNEGGRLAICSNNLIRNLSKKGPYAAEFAGFGIGISVEADTTVTGNVIEGAPEYGIGMGWGPYLRNVIAANNIIRKSPKGIVVSVVKGSGAASITGNTIEGASRGSIVGHEWTKAVTKDLALGSRKPFPHLTVERNIVS